MSISRKKHRRSYNTRLICKTLSYSVQDIAELFNLHKNAVLRWIKHGLHTIDDKKPYLVFGSDLIEYLQNKQNKRKHKCAPDEFFCCKCRQPRKAWEQQVDVLIRNQSKLTISGICAVCNTKIHRAGTVQKLAKYQKIFSIQTMRGQHIIDHVSPIVMCDSRKETKV